MNRWTSEWRPPSMPRGTNEMRKVWSEPQTSIDASGTAHMHRVQHTNTAAGTPAQVSTEFSLGWISNHPDLFVAAANKLEIEAAEANRTVHWSADRSGRIMATIHFTTDPAEGPLL